LSPLSYGQRLLAEEMKKYSMHVKEEKEKKAKA
jgi:hypothetical protein